MSLSTVSPFKLRPGQSAIAVAAIFFIAPVHSQPSSPPITALEPVTVTGTREKALLSETPISIGAIPASSIRETGALHPGQLLGQVPGVAVAVTNGEGHTTAIRQPFTTSPVYLFLEDGIPVRATGFFNHNSLYEVNIPMAGGIEVVRGPGTALYGSDAIGGIINVLSRAPLSEPHFNLSGEAGSFGTWRLMGSGGGALNESGAAQVDLNLTHTDGWRDRTAYDRQSGNIRFDQRIGRDGMLKTIVGVSKIDQQTGANSALPFNDYLNNPTRNNFSIAYRKVSAVRISVEYERQLGTGMVSIIPYFRDNAMELNGTFNLSFDPRIEKTHNVSYGLLAKWRKNLPFLRARVIGGVDLDYSPGSRSEDNLLVTRTGTGANTVFSAYTLGTRIYDYHVTFKSVSPYIHTEFSPTSALRLTAGLRYDSLHYDMQNDLGAGAVQASVYGANRFYGQLDENRTKFSRISPKLGATFALNKSTHLYASYNFGFRAPSEGQLYRAGNETTATNALTRAHLALGLKPIKAAQIELGLRGAIGGGWSYNVVAYDLEKKDDLVSQRDLATNVSTNVNAGRTEHRGIEAGVGTRLGERLRFDTALSYSRHRYVDWVTANANFSGRNIENAPKILANTRLTWRPVTAAMFQLEWVRIGSYWLDASNSENFGKYPGHDLLNLRASYAMTKNVEIFARVMNAADKRYADSASVSSNTAVFSPGLPPLDLWRRDGKLVNPHSMIRSLLLAVLVVAGLHNALGAAEVSHAHGGMNSTERTVQAELGAQAAFDAQGVLWSVHKVSEHIAVSRSEDGGRSWSNPVLVTPAPEPTDTGSDARPKIALGANGEIYLTWTKPLAKPYTGEIRFSRSLDGGRTFSAPLVVHHDGQEITHRFDAIAVNRKGQVFVAWIDKRDLLKTPSSPKQMYRGAAVYFAVSDDRGATFRGDFKAADHACECCRIALTARDDGSVAAMWRHIFEPNIRDHATATLFPDGQAGPVQRASFEDWRIDACPHHGPSVATDAAGRLHAVWFSAAPESRGVFYGKLREGRVDGLCRIGSASAKHADVATDGDSIAVVWKEYKDGRSHLCGMVSKDNGLTWREHELASVEGASDHPKVLSHGHRFSVFWNSREAPLSVTAFP